MKINEMNIKILNKISFSELKKKIKYGGINVPHQI